MNETTALLGITLAICVGAASPGPSFVMVARTAVACGRAQGLSAALGMGLGGLLLAIAALAGLNAAFTAVPALFIALKVVGGLYLAYLGIRIWRGARQPLDVSDSGGAENQERGRNHLLLGFTTQISNPKAAVVYSSVFAAFLPAAPSLQFDVAVAVVIFIIEAGWYAFVATVLSASAPRNTYLRCKTWVDRCAGGVMGALGLKLAASAVER